MKCPPDCMSRIIWSWVQSSSVAYPQRSFSHMIRSYQSNLQSHLAMARIKSYKRWKEMNRWEISSNCSRLESKNSLNSAKLWYKDKGITALLAIHSLWLPLAAVCSENPTKIPIQRMSQLPTNLNRAALSLNQSMLTCSWGYRRSSSLVPPLTKKLMRAGSPFETKIQRPKTPNSGKDTTKLRKGITTNKMKIVCSWSFRGFLSSGKSSG